MTLNITLIPRRSKASSYSISISTPKPPTSDLHAALLKELSQHKKPRSFADFLVPLPSNNINETESYNIIPIRILRTLSIL